MGLGTLGLFDFSTFGLWEFRLWDFWTLGLWDFMTFPTTPTTSSTSPPELELRPKWEFEHWKPGPLALEAFAAQQRSEARGDYQKRKEELWKAKDIREWAEYKLKLLTSSKKRHL